MSENKLIELSRCSVRVSHHQETLISCSNSSLIALSAEGINVFDYSHNLRCTDKQIDHLRSFIPVLKKSPATDLFTNSVCKSSMKNSQMTEMILDPALWPHNSQLMEEATRLVSAIWSPTGFIRNTEQAIAVLNCTGNVNIYSQNLHKWTNVLDLSCLVCKQFPQCFKIRHNFESIRNSAHTLITHSICWAPEKNDDNSCYFVTAQRNGSILLWSLHPEETTIQGTYLGKFDSNLGEILNMVWINKTRNKFLLLCSEIKGQLVAFDCEVVNNHVSLLETHKLWTQDDQMFVKSIHSIKISSYFILVFNKNRHVIIQMYDKKMTFLSQEIRKLNDYRVTAFANAPDGLLVATVNGKIYRMNIDIVDKKIIIDITSIDIKDLSSTMELYSMSLTKNNMFYILGMADRKMTFKKEPDYNEIVFTTREINFNNVMEIILNNPSRKLTDCWEYIELLRYKIHKTKKMPELDYKQLYTEGENNVYKLKIYLILLIFYTELGAMKNYYLKMPETSVEYLKEKLLVHHAVNLIHKIEEDYHSNGVWNGNEMEYIIGARNYLEIFCRKHKKCINDLICTSVFNEIKIDFNYTCQCCDNNIEEFTCKEGHINMFCSLTFTPIVSEQYLFCKMCGITARTDLGTVESLCVFCDFRLYKYQ